MQRAIRLATMAGLLFLSVTPRPAQAALTRVGEEEVVVQPHEVIEDDLVVYAPYVRVDGVVKGDLTVLGSEVVVEGIVEQDLLVAAKTLYLNGSVGDDLRVAAYAVALGEESRVADDSFTAAYSLEARPGSRNGGSVFAAARQVLLSGQVVEDVRVRSGALTLAGLTGGSVFAVVGGLQGVTHSSFVVDLAIEIPELEEGLQVASGAAIGGDLDHRSPDPARVSPDASIAGRVRHEPWDVATPGATPAPDAGPIGLPDPDSGIVDRLAVLLLLGLLLATATPGFLAERGDRIRERPIDLFGWGLGAIAFALLAFVVLGLCFLILLTIGLSTSLGGLASFAIVAGALTQGALVSLFLLALVYLAPVLASAGIGRALVMRLRPALLDPPDAASSAALAVAVGAVLYAGLRALPGLGVLVAVCGGLVGLGALTTWLRDRLR